MTGYQPDFGFLEKIGIEIGEDGNKTPIHNPDTMMTNVEGIYLAGVICGGLKTNKWFIENSRDHSKIIIKKIYLVNNSHFYFSLYIVYEIFTTTNLISIIYA